MQNLSSEARLIERETAEAFHQSNTQQDFLQMAFVRGGFMSDENIENTNPPPKQSIIAVVGSILGLVSLFIGVLAGVPAVILGHIALISIGKSSGKLAGTGLAIFALITGYITIAIVVFHLLNKS